MITKKQTQTLLETVKLIRDSFNRHDWERYYEKNYTKKPYVKNILFFYPKSKTQISYFVTKEEYKQWRNIIKKLCLTRGAKIEN